MKVIVHLHTILQRQTPEGMVSRLEEVIPSGYTLADLLQHLEIELDLEHLLLVVNGKVAEPDQIIQDGDQINLMPAISGGSSTTNIQSQPYIRYGLNDPTCIKEQRLPGRCSPGKGR